MSITVLSEVLERSEAKGVDRLVLLVLAETAWHDGVGWLDQKTIAHRTRASLREVKRALKELDEEGEIERRKAQRGRRRVGVYRVVVGSIAESDIDYDRLPFSVDKPFLTRGHRVTPSSDEGPTTDLTRGHLPSSQDAPLVREPSKEPSKDHGGDSAPPEKKPSKEQRDAAWDTLSAIYGEVAPHEKTRRGKIARDLALALLDRDPEAITTEIRRRAAVYRRSWPGAAFTDTALYHRWTPLGQMLSGPDYENRPPEERAKIWIEATGWRLMDDDDAVQILRDFGLAEERIAGALDYRARIRAERAREAELTDRLRAA